MFFLTGALLLAECCELWPQEHLEHLRNTAPWVTLQIEPKLRNNCIGSSGTLGFRLVKKKFLVVSWSAAHFKGLQDLVFLVFQPFRDTRGDSKQVASPLVHSYMFLLHSLILFFITNTLTH